MNSIPAPPADARPVGGGKYSLRKRILFARLFVISGAVVAFLGFVFVAYGMYWFGTPPPPPPPVCYSPCSEGFWWYQIIAIGLVLLGVGFVLALVGVAFKGPSKEWSEVALPQAALLQAGGVTHIAYRCSVCGASLGGSETRCPACGRSFENATKL